jgi:uncharacterized membrane protein
MCSTKDSFRTDFSLGYRFIPSRVEPILLDMEHAAELTTLQTACKAVGWCILFAFILPLVGAYTLTFSLSAVCAQIASAFLIEYGSIPIGIALGLPPLYALLAATSIEAGIFLGIFGMLDAIGTASGRVSGFLDWTRKMVHRSKLFDRYGILGLFPIEIIIGVYLCAPASWLFGWHKGRSFAITMAGYWVAAVATTFATLGVIHFFMK